MAKQPAELSADDIMPRKGEARGIDVDRVAESQSQVIAAVRDAAPDAQPEMVTFALEPSNEVATVNTQVRLPVNIARYLRILAVTSGRKQQHMMERWITAGVTEEWNRFQSRKPQ